ncbi:MAG: phenylalanine--tRNA ligase subunit alpha [Candidatus Vogelbacteria bacterium]|nr:phenylalanine--tRNA ligase subunit alpha [Candidatus Vogelbacteria bacterium]
MSIETNSQVKGHIHPLSQVLREVVEIFTDLGFKIGEGPEVESEFYNFDALNVPKDHPARDMHDTFWIANPENGREILRTHISSLQVRFMEQNKPPFRMISPGRVYRYEATDATHEAQFTYVEGLMVDKNVSMANLKGVLEEFLKRLFGKSNLVIRLRPSFFPFVEPAVEIDMSCFKCEGGGCGICKQTGWVEILGAGMVHPAVLNNGKIDPRVWKGFAFGGGIDRIAMLKYGVDDIRLFYGGDLRFIDQF